MPSKKLLLLMMLVSNLTASDICAQKPVNAYAFLEVKQTSTKETKNANISKQDVVPPEDDCGIHYISIAACVGDLDEIQSLYVEHETCEKNQDNVTKPLREAVYCEQAKVVDWLLQTKQSTPIPLERLEGLLYLAIQNDDPLTFELLLNRSSELQTNDYYTNWLFSTARNNSKETFLRLLELGADIRSKDHEGEKMIHLASSNYEVLEIILKKGIDVNSKNARGQTALHLTNDPRCIQLLLKYKVDLDLLDDFGWAPLHYAVLDGDLPIITSLIDCGADKKVRTQRELAVFNTDVIIKRRSNCKHIAKVMRQHYKRELRLNSDVIEEKLNE